MSGDQLPAERQTLAAIGFEVVRLFTILNSSSIDDYKGLRKGDIIEQHERFDLWAINIGLYQTGHASLDYRFRDAPSIRKFCFKLLEDLAKALEIVTSEILVFNGSLHEDIANGQDEAGTIETSDDEEDLDSYDDGTTAEFAFTSIKDCIDRLFRLSMKVRNPAMRTGLSKGFKFRKIDPDTGRDLYECFAELQVDERFITDLLISRNFSRAHSQDLPDHLIARLSKANNQRRRQFAYWREHSLKLVERSERLRAIQQDRLEPQTNILSPSQYSRPTTATLLNPANINLDDDSNSVISIVSIQLPETSEDTQEVAEYPDPPEKYMSDLELKEFECPYCFTICSAKTLKRREWKAHLLKDLRPYLCTFKHCDNSSQLYDSFNEWFSHELHHLNHGNDESSTASVRTTPQVDGEAGTSNELDLSRSRKCPLCDKLCQDLKGAAQHIASHLIRIALFTLPRSTGLETEDEDQSAASSQKAAEQTGSDGSRLPVSMASSWTDTLPPDQSAKLSPSEKGLQNFGNSPVAIPEPHAPETTILGRSFESSRFAHSNSQNSSSASVSPVEAVRVEEEYTLIDKRQAEVNSLADEMIVARTQNRGNSEGQQDKATIEEEPKQNDQIVETKDANQEQIAASQNERGTVDEVEQDSPDEIPYLNPERRARIAELAGLRVSRANETVSQTQEQTTDEVNQDSSTAAAGIGAAASKALYEKNKKAQEEKEKSNEDRKDTLRSAALAGLYKRHKETQEEGGKYDEAKQDAVLSAMGLGSAALAALQRNRRAQGERGSDDESDREERERSDEDRQDMPIAAAGLGAAAVAGLYEKYRAKMDEEDEKLRRAHVGDVIHHGVTYQVTKISEMPDRTDYELQLQDTGERYVKSIPIEVNK